jgi:hypothetical protein
MVMCTAPAALAPVILRSEPEGRASKDARCDALSSFEGLATLGHLRMTMEVWLGWDASR